MDDRSVLRHALLLLGVALVAVGLTLTVAMFVDLGFLVDAWPMLVVAPALVVLAAALAVPAGRKLSFLAVPGAVTLSVGLLLQVQAITGDWASWTYAWALVMPAAAGAGILIAGVRERLPGVRRAGWRMLFWGVTLFAAAEQLFTGVLPVGGPGLGDWFSPVLPIAVIIIGLGSIRAGLRRRS